MSSDINRTHPSLRAFSALLSVVPFLGSGSAIAQSGAGTGDLPSDPKRIVVLDAGVASYAFALEAPVVAADVRFPDGRINRRTGFPPLWKLASVIGACAIALVGSSAFAAGRTRYPLTLENCGRKVTFEKAPDRAVSIGQNSTEILFSLGLAPKMVGTGSWLGPVLPNLKADNDKVPRISNTQPSFEAVVKNDPDLVAAQFVFDVVPNGVVGKHEHFEELGVSTYISPGDCAAKDNSMRDGSRSELFSMDSIYQEITELAAIFDVQDKGDAFIAELKDREAKAIASVSGTKAAHVSLVFWFSSSNISGDAWMAGRNGVPGYIAQKLGVTNPVRSDEEWPGVSWEAIAAANPTAIVVGTMDRRKFPADDPKVKIAFMEADPVVSKLDAVKTKRFIELSAQAMNPTIRTIDGIETVAAGQKRLKLAE